jgi:AraC-like DNA-binding protein
MPLDAESLSWFTLLETRDRLIRQLRHDVPSVWPDLIRSFLAGVRAIPGPLPAGALLLLLADLARELDRLAAQESTTTGRPQLLTALDLRYVSELPADALCLRFEEALLHWCTRLEPGALTSEVQAHRIAAYIDGHFAEPITLGRLSQLSGCRGRHLSRAFRSSMRMSIREYHQATRIDQAAARLRQGDKVESVLATVGWRGRKNFFRHFKDRLGTTPAQYRDSWMVAPPRLDGSLPPPRSPRSARVRTSSNCRTV